MTVHKLHFLLAGRCSVAASMLDSRRAAQPLVDLPIWCYLIETSDGPILIDTGMPDECVGRPDLFATPGDETSIVPQMTEADRIVHILERVGYRPSDIVCVISTHTHFDHAGGNRHFEATEVVMQQMEYDAIILHLQDTHDLDFWSRAHLRYRLVSGDYQLAPGIQLLFTPGHSVGHQSVLMRTPKSGSVLLTIDAAYQVANFEDDVPFAVADAALARASIQKLREIATAEKARVFFGHDTQQERRIELYPVAY